MHRPMGTQALFIAMHEHASVQMANKESNMTTVEMASNHEASVFSSFN